MNFHATFTMLQQVGGVEVVGYIANPGGQLVPIYRDAAAASAALALRTKLLGTCEAHLSASAVAFAS